jgi:hypothetical protein
MIFIFQQLVEPFFYNGFSIAAGNADHRKGKLPAVISGKLLQGGQGIFDEYDIRIGERVGGRAVFHYKIPYSPSIQLLHKKAAIPARSFQGEEQGGVGKDQPAAIQQKMLNQIISPELQEGPLHDVLNVLYRIFHRQLI